MQKPSHVDFFDGTNATDFDEDEREILVMKKKKIALGNKSDQIQSKLDSLLNRVSDKISDLHTVKEESDGDNHDDLSRFGSELGGPESAVRTKEGAREFAVEYMMQTVIEECIFEQSLKVDKVKHTLMMWVHRRRFLGMKKAAQRLNAAVPVI